MKTLQTNNKSRSNRMITGIGKIVLFAFLFMFVFSMVCIVMDANISSNIENGTFDNIALAAFTTHTGRGDYEEGTNTASSIGSTVVWKKATCARVGGANVNLACSFSITGDLATFVSAGVIQERVYFTVSNQNRDNTFYIKANNSSGSTISTVTGSSETTHYGSYGSNTATTLYVYFTGYGSLTDQFEANNMTIQFASKSYTISVNGNSGSGGTSSVSASGGVALGNIDTAWTRTGYQLDGYYTASSGGSKLFNANGTPVASVSGYTDASKRWVHNGDITVYAHWTANKGTITYNANGGSGSLSGLTNNQQTITYAATNTLHSGSGFTRSGYTLIGWTTTSSGLKEYSLGQNIGNSIENINLASATGSSLILYAVWAESDFGGTKNSTWGSSSNPFLIESLKHLQNLSMIVNNDMDPVDSVQGTFYGNTVTSSTTTATSRTYANCYFKVTNASITGYSLIIGKSSTYYFAGTFDGDGKTIGLSINNGSTAYTGLFGYTKGGSIKYVTTSGTVQGGQYTAGIVGYADGTAILSCNNSANITGGGQTAGIIGQGTGTTSLSGTITNTGKISGSGMVGGIGGQYHGTFGASSTITNGASGNKNHASIGNITGTGDSVGGCFGFFDKTTASVTALINYGTVNGKTSLGGIVGRVQNVIKNAKNYGNVVSTSTSGKSGELPTTLFAIGGITGYTNNNIQNSLNEGNISNTNATGVGGIVGVYMVNTSPTISNCYNKGTITASSNVGGIAGYWHTALNYCYNEGAISASSNYGGIVGYLADSPTLTHCYSVTTTYYQAVGSGNPSSSSKAITIFKSSAASPSAQTGGTNWYYAAYPTGIVITPTIGGSTTSAWTNMVSSNIDGYTAKLAIANNHYCSLTVGSSNTQPNAQTITGYSSSVAKGSVAYNTSSFDLTLTCNYASSTPNNNILDQYLDLAITSINPYYSTYAHNINSFTTATVPAYSKEFKHFTSSNAAVTDCINAGTYNVVGYPYTGNALLGITNTSSAITIKKLPVSSGVKVVFDGDYTKSSPTVVIGGNTYASPKTSNSAPYSIYRADDSKFHYYLVDKNNGDTIDTTVDLMASGDISRTVNGNTGSDNIKELNAYLTANTSNLSGSVTYYYEWATYDYSGRPASGSKVWGKAANPYVINNVYELIRLYDICTNDDTSWGSINNDAMSGDDIASCTTKRYASGVFYLNNDFDVSAYVDFRIGKDATNYFGGSMYGKNGSTDTMRTVTLATNMVFASEYQRVEYIGFSGTQWIGSGVTSLTNSNFSITIDFKRADTANADSCLFGQRQFGKFTNIYNGYYESAYGNTASGTAADTDRHILVMNQNGIYKDGTALLTSFSWNISSSYEGIIGAFSEDSIANAKWPYKGNIYRLTIVDNGTCIRDFVPCVRKSDSVAGLYDLVNQVFYTNQGTGTFTVGSNVGETTSVGNFAAFIGYFRAASGATCYMQNITTAGRVTGKDYSAGLLGYVYATSSSSKLYLVNATNTARVIGNKYVGGLAGYFNNSNGHLQGTITNLGEISSTSTYTGGIMGYYVGYLDTNTTIVNGDSSNPNHATIGYVHTTNNYAAGCFGYKDSRTMADISGTTVTNYGKVDGKAALGGIAGRTTVSISGAKNYGTITSTGNNLSANSVVMVAGSAVGGIAGLTQATLKNCENYGAVSGTTVIGGIVGTFYYCTTNADHPEYADYHPTITGCKNKANVTASSSNSYVGGLAGIWRGNITNSKNEENGAAITIDGKSYVGGFVGRYYHYEACKISSPANIASVKGTGSYIGGIVGYNGGEISGTVSNNKLVTGTTSGQYVGGFIGANVGGTLTAITKLTISGGVTGKHYVGGYIGASKNSAIRIGTNSTLSGTITATSGSYVGGAFGYIYATGSMTTDTARSDSGSYFRFTPSSFTADLVHSGATGNYVGGIVGYCAGISIENGENTTFTAWEVKSNLAGVYYVGGAIGYLTTFPTASEVVTTFDSAITGMPTPTAASESGTVGPGVQYSLTYTESDVSYTKYFVPTIYGTLTRSGHTLTVTSNGSFASGMAMDFVSTSISGWYKNAKTVSGTSFVGGLIGRIDTGVGNYVTTDAYARGADGSSYIIGVAAVDDAPASQDLVIKFQNTGAISGKYFVGGTIGALLNNYNSSVAKYTSNIKAVVSNTANVTVSNGYYAGGIIGSIGTYLDADRQDSYGSIQINGLVKFNANDNEGSFSGSKTAEVTVGGSGTYYVGGAAGFMNASGDNRIANFVTTSKVNGTRYVGGLAGSMAGGANEVNGSSIYRCVASPNSSVTITTSTNYYSGTYYTGGLVGDAGAITISNSYVLGFYFSNVDGDRGGVVGRSTSSTTFVNAWTIHLVSGLSYTTSYGNSNGKFILIDPDYAVLPNYDEILVTAGLKTDAVGTKRASHNSFEAAYGYLSIKATIPSGSGSYLVFYDINGSMETNPNRYIHMGTDDTLYDGVLYGGKSGEPTNELYSKTKASASSFILAKGEAKFVNLEYNQSNVNSIPAANWIAAFNNGRISNEYTIESISYSYSSGTFNVSGTVYYNNISTGSSEDKWKVGSITKSLTEGSEDMPISIPDQATWISYATNVRNGTNYYGKTFKLLNDINLGSSSNILFGTTSNVFRGTLDGNGKTLTYTISGSDNVGLFPSIGQNATIKNLYLAGSVTGSGNSVGGLIGTCPNTSVTIQNVDTSVNVQGTYHVGGLVGYANGGVTIKDAVNTGTVRETSTNTNGGAGGIIGTIAQSKSASIDSVRNAGTVRGNKSIGGIIGYVYGSSEILNSCNTGLVESISYTKDTFAYAGGIVGQVSTNGNVNVYACYNSGKVWGYTGRVGGILGCDTDSRTSSSGRTKVFFCFNSGNVLSGHPAHCEEVYGGNNTFQYYNGGEVGGLVGMAINADIYYCYNIGEVTTFGCTSHLYESQLRAGGLVGMMYRYHDDTYTSLAYCYNAGIVKARCPVDNAIYISGLVGCSIYERSGWFMLDVLVYWSGANNIHSSATVAHNFSLHGQVDLGKLNGTQGTEDMTRGSKYSDEDGYFGVDRPLKFMENHRNAQGFLYMDFAFYAANWTLQDTVITAEQMVGRYDSTNGLGQVPSGMASEWSNGGSYGSTVLLRTSGAIKSNSNFGYIYLPGCLPQLSIFATDTESGVAMTGQTSGYDTTTQKYDLKTAGTEFSPYVIQNGIDLLGLSQIIAIDTTYNASGKYYAFANGYNNLDGNKLTTLNMNTLNLYDMKYYSQGGYRAGVTNKSILGYTYGIASESGSSDYGLQTWYNANYNDSRNIGKNIRLYRRANHNYLDGNSSYGSNFFQIGQSETKSFNGSLVGFREVVNGEEISYPEIQNIHIKNTKNNTDANENGQSSAYAAMVGYGYGCILRDFSLGTGSTITVSTSATNAYAAGFVAKAMYNTTLTGLQMHSGSSVTISKTNGGTSYAGGIAGFARPNVTNASGSNLTTIEECSSAADISTSSSTSTDAFVGGILGFAQGLSTYGTAGIYINECSTVGGTITNGSNKVSGIGTGGILGGRNSIGKVNITNCKVGPATGATTTIKGAHSLAGIISYTNGATEADLTTIQNCEVGSKAVIQRTQNTNSSSYGAGLGGFVGYTTRCLITGKNIFKGTISASSYAASNIGGLLGYMGSYTNVQGSVHIYGIIDTGTTASTNIGGAIGYVPTGGIVNIDGNYYINPQMTTSKAKYVGGFIGYNGGTAHILGSSSILDITGDAYATVGNAQAADDSTIAKTSVATANTISADESVGGFIGYNASTGTLYVGHQTDAYNTASVGTFTATLVANVNGNKYVGGFVGYNGGLITTADSKCYVVNTGKISETIEKAQYIGGIVGYNAAGAHFNVAVQENYFANAGQVGNPTLTEANRASYAGGVVGNTLGTFTNIGTLANTGAVYGKDYVGGSIGYFPSGALFGTMINGKAKEDNDGNLVSNSSKNVSGNTVTYITQVSTNATSATATEIYLNRTVTQDAKYSYSIGKTIYYFTAPITGTVIAMDFEHVTITGNITTSANSDINTGTSNQFNLSSSNIINASTTYKYTLGPNEFYYASPYYGAVYTIPENDPDLITIYPTLKASTSQQAGASYSVVAVGAMTSGYKRYTSGSTYYFDASNLTGTIKDLVGENVVFSELKISAVRREMQGTMTAREGEIIAINQNYTFLVGTTRYFFKSPVNGQITNMTGNILTISPFTQRSVQKVVANNEIKAGHNYIYQSTNWYRFTSPVTGTITTVSGATATLKSTITAERSALSGLTANWNIGGSVIAGHRYKFNTPSGYRYFVAPYSGDVTQIYESSGTYYVGITNTDYSDMVVDDTVTSSGYTAGYVNGFNNVGGVVAIVEAAASVGFYTEGGNLVRGVYTRFINFGTVASTDGTNVGGSIGTMKGNIYDKDDTTGLLLDVDLDGIPDQQYIEFYNYGKVYVKQNGGGSIGVFSGQGAWARMFNYSDTTIMGAENNGTITSYANIGGCIGLVQSEGGNPVILRNSIMVNSGLVSAQTNRLTVGNENVAGQCIGGVIGKIDDYALGNTQNDPNIDVIDNWSVDLYSDGSVIAGRTTSDSANYAPMNYVGGLIGYIGATPVILESVLNYTKRSGGSGVSNGSSVTFVSGHHYVGGIVGFNDSTVGKVNASGTDEQKASIKYCYNVGGRVISDDYLYSDAYNSSGTCGGIVGGIGSNRPLTYCCYWVSPFGNDSLKNATVTQLGTSLTSEWISYFTAYDISLLQYSPTNWTDYLYVYDAFYSATHSGAKPYAYYSWDSVNEVYTLEGYIGYAEIILDTSNTYSAGEIEEATEWFNANVLDVEWGVGIYEYGGTDVAPISAAAYEESGYETLKQCVATRKGFNLADLEENTDGDLGIHIGGNTKYSTGNDNTGYFFAYAYDAVSNGFSQHEIQTEHTSPTNAQDFDLNVWKYISQAFGASDVGQSSSQLIYNYSATDDTYNANNTPKTESSKAIGNAQIYHIYAKTYAPDVNGYYLYAYAVNKDGFKVSYDVYDNAIYIDADSAVCKNVLIFFKKVTLGTVKLTYNSLERYAPITGLTAVEKTDQQYTYYALNGGSAASGVNYGVDAGTYQVDASIYYVPNVAYTFTASTTSLTGATEITTTNKNIVEGSNYKYTVGSTEYFFTAKVDGWVSDVPTSMKYEVIQAVKIGEVVTQGNSYTWKINPRKTGVTNTNVIGTYNAAVQTAVLTISQIVGSDATDDTYTVSNLTSNGVYPKLTFTPSLATPYPSCSILLFTTSFVTSSTGASQKDGGYCSSTTTYSVKQYDISLSAINAGTYKVRADSLLGTRKDNYQLTPKEVELRINKRTLTATWHTDSYTYDGNEHSISLDLSNWAAGESTNNIKSWTDAISFELTKENSSGSGSFTKNPSTVYPSGSTSISTTKSTIEFRATNKNQYFVNWTANAAVGTNYVMPANEQGDMTIATLQIVANGITRFNSATYNGSEQTVIIKLKSVDAHGNNLTLSAATISTIYEEIKTKTRIEKSGAGPSGTGVVTDRTYSAKQTSAAVLDVTITYHLKNAGTYTCKVLSMGSASGDYYMSSSTANVTNQTIIQKSLTITPVGESAQYSTSSPGASSVFNNVNLGLTRVDVKGFVSSSEASSLYSQVIAATSGGFTAIPSTSSTTVSYSTATKNVGNYSFSIVPIVNTNYTFLESSYYWRITTRTLVATATWAEVDVNNSETLNDENLSATASIKNYTYSTYTQGLRVIVFSNLASGHTAQNVISATVSNNLQPAIVSGNNLTIKEVGQNYVGTDDAGTYTVNIGYKDAATNSNYTIDFKTRWTISPVSIKARSNITSNTEAYYTGNNHNVVISYLIGETTLNNNVYGQDTISGSNAQITVGGNATNDVCNVGVYTLTVANTIGNGGISASRSNSDKSANYTLDTTGFSSNITYTINPLTIQFIWNENNSFVYNGATHKRVLDGIKLYAGEDCVSGETVISPKTTPTDAVNGGITTTYSFIGRTSNETLTIIVVSEESINYLASGYYSAVANYIEFRATGNNAANIATIEDNYIYGTSNSSTFSIYKSIITVNTFETITTIAKTYDGTTTIDSAVLDGLPIKDNYARATFISSNGGANTPTYNITSARYQDAIVGIGKTIIYTVTVMDTNNYNFTSSSNIGYNGIIEARVLQISLYLKSGTTATKQYDDTELYGTASNTNGQTSARSAKYRLGQGFTVSNIVANETSGHVIITGIYREANSSRRTANGTTGEPSYNKYVNNVVYNNGTYSINNNAGHYKQLVFSISGDSSNNYTMVIVNPALGGSPASEVVISDTRSYESSLGYTLLIEITRTQIKIENYGNTVQSYAQTNNVYTYQTEEGWMPVSAEKPARVSSLLQISITNEWMYQTPGDHASGWAHITSYRRIVGGQGKTLYAELTGSQGMEQNYVLRNQPILIIDYFVVEDTDHYQISTLAGLMLASYYHNNYATLGDGGESDPSIVYTWTVICTEEQYVANPESYQDTIEENDAYFDPDAVYPGDNTKTGVWGYWAQTPAEPIKYNKFRLMADISGIMTESDYDILKNAFGMSGGHPIWGYGFNYLTNFVQTSAGNQVTVIGNLFANTFVGEFDGNGYTIKNFNMIYNVSTDVATTVNVGFFGYATTTSLINDMNLRDISISVYDATTYANVINVGGLIGLSDMTHSLTNTTVHTMINVYAVGTNKIVNVGGVVGFYVGQITNPDVDATAYNLNTYSFASEYDVSVAIENVIAIGHINVNNGGKNNIGGILGSIRSGDGGAAIFNAVTLNEIQSRQGTTLAGGIIGYVVSSYTYLDGKVTAFTQTTSDIAVSNEKKYILGSSVAQYLQDSILIWTGATTYSFVNKMIGNVTTTGGSNDAARKATGVSYSELAYNGNYSGYRRSVSHYINTSSTYIYLPENTVNKGLYDIISEKTSGDTPKYYSYASGESETYTSNNPRESLRFTDIVYTYILRLETSVVNQTITVDTKSVTVRVYKQEQENTMLGSRRGTEHQNANNEYDDRILMGYSQHYPLLRMFRFASFELTKQINLPTNNYNIVYIGAFYGHVYSDKVQVISSNAGSYTTRKIGTKTYTTLADYVVGYQKFYGLTLEVSGGYYVYKDPAKINVGIMIQNKTETMFEVEKNTIPYTREELKTGG